MAIRLLAFLLMSLCAFVATAQERRHDQPITDELYAIIQQRSALIEKDISESKHNDWNGVYLAGDHSHHPDVFMWSLKNGFVVTSSIHTFSPSWVNFGKVSFENNRLKIFPELTKDDKSSHIMANEFVPVLWGEQHFLIEPERLINFAYVVHSGSGSEIEQFFSKAGEPNEWRKGLPSLPSEYQKYMKMKAIQTRVLKVGAGENIWSQLITIDAGSKSGVIEGMIFYSFRKPGNHFRIRIVEVANDTSIARLSGISSSVDGDGDSTIQPRWSFTSKMPKEFADF